jgi:2-dehydropantoate 2-reductase
MNDKPKIAIVGAGSIGCYVGARLLLANQDVKFLGRESLGQTVRAKGLTVTSLDGERKLISSEKINWSHDISDLKDCKIFLICVKSAQTEDIGRQLSKVAKAGSLIISLQNGLSNTTLLKKHLSDSLVLAGLVVFNVIPLGENHYKVATSGPIQIEKNERASEFVKLLNISSIACHSVEHIESVQWSKLILNLNNSVNALTGLTLKEQLENRHLRILIAQMTSEALGILNSAGIKPAKMTAVPVGLLPAIFRLPTWLFKIVAASQIKIDPSARTSMWQDLDRQRTTEIDYLNGEIVRLAKSLGKRAPLNEKIIDLVKQAETQKRGSPRYSPKNLLSLVNAMTV